MREGLRPRVPQASGALGIVITGGTAGLGLAMAREFLLAGDRVVICGRDKARLDSALRMLTADVPKAELHGMAADVSIPEDAAAFASFVKSKLGTVNRWINNAGTAGAYRKPLWELEPDDIGRTCQTNLSGSMMLCAEALRLMVSGCGQSDGREGHIFNMGFSLAGMNASPTAIPHRASKRAVALTTTMIRKELRAAGIGWVGVHEVSPGLVLTDLLLKDAGVKERQTFNAIAETPETVAALLVPKMRAARGAGGNIRYRSVFQMLVRLFASRFGYGRARFFDSQGRPVTVRE